MWACAITPVDQSDCFRGLLTAHQHLGAQATIKADQQVDVMDGESHQDCIGDPTGLHSRLCTALPAGNKARVIGPDPDGPAGAACQPPAVRPGGQNRDCWDRVDALEPQQGVLGRGQLAWHTPWQRLVLNQPWASSWWTWRGSIRAISTFTSSRATPLTTGRHAVG